MRHTLTSPQHTDQKYGFCFLTKTTKKKKERITLCTTLNAYGGPTTACTVYNGAPTGPSSRYALPPRPVNSLDTNKSSFASLTRSSIDTDSRFYNHNDTFVDSYSIFIVLGCTDHSRVFDSQSLFCCERVNNRLRNRLHRFT